MLSLSCWVVKFLWKEKNRDSPLSLCNEVTLMPLITILKREIEENTSMLLVVISYQIKPK
ncbi:MAG: hypothetical protein DM484_00240 [Candidatus Methylumidiphilus alinenensis]|uniref:Uncharacterized protein n=1 Tax=Candidatus Methylumidiphilus alinenensis TaxID=2202197 RepID=A0A2W4RUT2_9GAMM|nr:MAG: hypothetical protein DM484_00240 [Candidatus Methylumidiphilus alinenensis]